MSETLETKCRIEEVFDPGFLELLRLVPRNPHVRALILKFTGKVPGVECETFEQVREWVEANCKPRPLFRGKSGGLSIPVDFSETEYGRAGYSVRRYGREEFQLDTEELLEMAESAASDGESLDELVEKIAEKIQEDAWTACDPQMDDSGDYEYNDHDMSGTEDSETSCSKSDIRLLVLNWLRERHPALAEQLQ